MHEDSKKNPDDIQTTELSATNRDESIARITAELLQACEVPTHAEQSRQTASPTQGEAAQTTPTDDKLDTAMQQAIAACDAPEEAAENDVFRAFFTTTAVVVPKEMGAQQRRKPAAKKSVFARLQGLFAYPNLQDDEEDEEDEEEGLFFPIKAVEDTAPEPPIAAQSKEATQAPAKPRGRVQFAPLPQPTAQASTAPDVPDVPKPVPEAPAKVETVKAEPAKAEPAKAEPAKVEPAKAEPAKVEPAKAEPAKVEPAKVEPAKAEPAKAEPAKAEPVKAEPAKVEPIEPVPESTSVVAKPEPSAEQDPTEALLTMLRADNAAYGLHTSAKAAAPKVPAQMEGFFTEEEWAELLHTAPAKRESVAQEQPVAETSQAVAPVVELPPVPALPLPAEPSQERPFEDLSQETAFLREECGQRTQPKETIFTRAWAKVQDWKAAHFAKHPAQAGLDPVDQALQEAKEEFLAPFADEQDEDQPEQHMDSAFDMPELDILTPRKKATRVPDEMIAADAAPQVAPELGLAQDVQVPLTQPADDAQGAQAQGVQVPEEEDLFASLQSAFAARARQEKQGATPTAASLAPEQVAGEQSLPTLPNETAAVAEISLVKEGAAVAEISLVKEDAAVAEISLVKEGAAVAEISLVKEDAAVAEISLVKEDAAVAEISLVKEDAAVAEISLVKEGAAVAEISLVKEDAAVAEISLAQEDAAVAEITLAQEETSAPEQSIELEIALNQKEDTLGLAPLAKPAPAPSEAVDADQTMGAQAPVQEEAPPAPAVAAQPATPQPEQVVQKRGEYCLFDQAADEAAAEIQNGQISFVDAVPFVAGAAVATQTLASVQAVLGTNAPAQEATIDFTWQEEPAPTQSEGDLLDDTLLAQAELAQVELVQEEEPAQVAPPVFEDAEPATPRPAHEPLPEDPEGIQFGLSGMRVRLLVRTFTTGVFAVALFLLGLMAQGVLPVVDAIDPSAAPVPFLLVNLVLMLTAAGVSYPVFIDGITGLWRKPSPDTLPALAGVAALLQLLLCLALVESYQPASITLFSALAGLALFADALGNLVMALVMQANFNLASAGVPHYLAYHLRSKDAQRTLTRGLEVDHPALLLSRPVQQIESFLEKSFSPRASDKRAQWAAYGLLGAAALAFLLAFIKGQGALGAMSSLAGVLCVGVPLSVTLLAALPSVFLQRAAAKVGAVVPGWQSIEALGDINLIAVNGADLFPPMCAQMHGIKTFQKERVDLAILYATSILVESCDTLQNLFAGMIDYKTELLYPVKDLTVRGGLGFIGWCENYRVILGTRALMQAEGVPMPALDYENRYTKEGKRQVLYLSVSGQLYGMFVVGYRGEKNIARALRVLRKEHIRLLVRCSDPTLTAHRIEEIYRLPAGFVTLLSPEQSAVMQSATDYRPKAEGCMLHLGNFASLVGGLKAASGAAQVERSASAIQLVWAAFSAVLCLFLCLTDGLMQVPLAAILLYQMAWCVINLGVVFTKKFE